MSQLSDFLSEHKITTEAIIAASAQLEKLSPEEREVMVKRVAARVQKKSYTELSLAKPKSRGRGVTSDVVTRALAGAPLPRLARQKIVRAVSSILVSAKKSPVDWRPLFADAKVMCENIVKSLEATH